MVQIISIANQKGGVGKTTTAVNLSAGLALSGKKTLLVDCDPQGNATTGAGINKTELEKTLYHALIGQKNPDDITMQTEIKNLFIIPSKVELIGFEVEILNESDREVYLDRVIEQISHKYDYIILDCPPSLSLLTLNALAASDKVLIPLQSEFYALEGLTQLLQTIRRVKQNINTSLKISGILLTMFDKRTNLSSQVEDDARLHFKNQVFNTKIPRNIRLSEAPSYGMPIFLYSPASKGAKSYLDLAKEIIKTDKKHEKQ
ncbi:MAG: ParA family protein [Thermodesulfobacteriota bacterium]